jgi:signal transduction histidine kinase
MERPGPDVYQPRITRLGHAARLVGMLALSALVWGPLIVRQWQDHRTLFWLDLVLGVAAYALVFWRRRQPLAIGLATAALGTLSGLAAGPAFLAAFSIATRRRVWPVVAVGLANVAGSQVYTTVEPVADDTAWWLNLTLGTIFTIGAMGWGMYIGSRRELVWNLQQRAMRAEAEQELRVSQARGTERARIAREMHDVLAHRISQISLHAGALGFRTDLDADELRDRATVIRDLANDALTDLRGVLGVLRDTETGQPASAPLPTLADLPALVEQAREAGVHVEFEDRLMADVPLPDVVGRTIYRIVQEGITNAAKHAPGAVLRIEVSGSPEDGIDITLRNPIGFGPSRTPGSGLGLIGLTERAELRGGRLEGRNDGSSFVLRGWIPWAA